MQRTMRSRVVWTLIAAGGVTLADPSPSSAQTSSPYRLIVAVVDGLSEAQQALENQDNARSAASADRRSDDALVLATVQDATDRLIRALLQLKPFLDDSNDNVKQAAELLAAIYSRLVALQEVQVALLEEGAVKDAPTRLKESSNAVAAQNELWRLLAETVTAAASVLIDFDRKPPQATRRYLNITAKERDDLLQRMRRNFPIAVVQGGQRAPEMAAALLAKWLSDEAWLPADAEKQ